MKKLILTLLSVIYLSTISIAQADPAKHETMYIKQHWLSMTTSFDIETKTQKLGTLYRRFMSLLLRYDFYDPFNNKIATAKSKFFSVNAHFDIYDNNNQLLGSADDSLFAFFPTFYIYDKNNVTKLAKAKMNFWGTTFYVYDPISNKEMAQLYRPFFRMKNDWTFEVTDHALFDSKNIDKRVLLTIIAFQGDREYWEQQRRDNDKKRNNSTRLLTAETQLQTSLQAPLNLINQQLEPNYQANPETLNKLSKDIELAYKQSITTNSNFETGSRSEQINDYINFCLGYLQNSNLSHTEKQGLLYLLKVRLENAA